MSDYSSPPSQQFKYPSSLTSTIHHRKNALLPISVTQSILPFPEENAAEDRIEQVFEEDDGSRNDDEYQHHFHDALTQIADAVNLSAVRLLGNEAQSLTYQALLKKKKRNLVIFVRIHFLES